MNYVRYVATLVVLTMVVPQAVTHAEPAPAQGLCFNVPGVNDCIDQRFRSYWEMNGGLAVFGYPISPALPEQTADGLWLTQHFERNRLELHPDAAAPFAIQLGRLGADRLGQDGRDWKSEAPGQQRDDCRFFTVTRHAVCEPFLGFWLQHGLDLGDPGVSEREALALWGLPVTEPRRERNSSGDEVVTQWFERGRFEDHGAQGVVLGRLGAEVDQGASGAVPAAGWVTIQGSHLEMGGQPVRLKGVNYYPADHPWGFMWTDWDSAQIERDMARMEHEVGANVVRLLVPYHASNGWSDDRGHVSNKMLDRLQQAVQIAGNHHMKVVLTLFDWHGMLETAARPYELQYLRRIVDVFRDDDRVLAWDLHNEPDNYADWKLNAPGVVQWVTSLADALHAMDQRHPVTVGAGREETLELAGPDGRSMLDVSDLVSVHGYDAAMYGPMLTRLHQLTSKPLLLEEFGWPTGPVCVLPFHDEASQLYLFQQAARALQLPGVVGGLSWWLQDSTVSEDNPTETQELYFGLYHYDGTPKPSLGVMRGIHVQPLSSVMMTQRPLTVARLVGRDPLEAPIHFGNVVLIGSFLHFWKFFGGERTFGKPLTQPYRQSDGTMVQYFEKARFELNESVHVQPIDVRWPEGQTDYVYLDRVHLTMLGQQASVGRHWTQVADPHEAGVLFLSRTGHTLRGAFRRLWETHGEPFFGLPLNEPTTETIDGQQRTVQYFEKWRMELMPDGTVRLGDLGRDALAQRPCVRGW
ncbi:MAG: hypothetical protein NVS2B7_28580 [Herpetosiphon sp.]